MPAARSRAPPPVARLLLAGAGILILVSLSVVTTGCISYGLQQIPRVERLPPPPAPDERPSLACLVRSMPGSIFGSSSAQATATGVGAEPMTDEVLAALAATGWFRSVRRADAGPLADSAADLQLDVVVSAQANDAVMFAGAMLAFMIPTWRTTTFELTAEVRASDGAWRQYHLQDAARDVHWLPLILVMSFQPWGGVYGEIRDNLYRTLVARMHADGLLRRPTASAPEAAGG